jgi:hypothetical protein
VGWFNGGCKYAICLNMSLPQANTLKDSLRKAIGASKRYRKEVVLVTFKPKDEAPVPIEVCVGGAVPLEIAQALLAELAKVADLPLAITVEAEPDEEGSPLQICVGSMVDRAKPAVTPEKMSQLLDPNLSQDEFLQLIEADD